MTMDSCDRIVTAAARLGAALAALVPAVVQAQPAAAPKETVQVTGSRLDRVEAETALPLTIITREDIQATGQTTVAEVLRTISFNTQGSSVPITGSTGQGVTDVNLRGLGFGRTLVLINGRRIPVDSAFFGFAASTMFVPIGAVERIEILREGASSVYGSDALGGVVNIILRKEFKGLEGFIEYSDPAEAGGSNQVYALTGGHSWSRGGVVMSLEHRKMERISRADRDYVRSEADLGFNYLSNSFPPTYRVTDLLGTGTNVLGPFETAGCPAALVRTTQTATGVPQRECRNPVGNKTDLVPEFEVDSIYVSGRFDLGRDFGLFGELLYSRQDSAGRSNPVTLTRAMTAANPNNPTRGATPANPVAGATGPRPISVLFALPDEYTRTLTSESTYRSVVAGIDWKPALGDLTVYYQNAKQDADNVYANALRTATFNAAFDSGALNPFALGNPDRFAPYIATGTRFTESKLEAAAVSWTSTVPGLRLPGGNLGYGAGVEWRKESLIETCDALTAVFALNGAFCFQRPLAERTVKAYFVEAAAPVLKGLELGYAGRHDDYSLPDFGRTTHRFSVRYQPVSSLVLRASHSEGVRAPNLFEISSASGTATTTVIDTRRCAQAGGNPSNPACQPVSITQTIRGGPTLRPEESTSPSIGFVWSPTRNFSISVDRYRVEVDDQIANLSNQAVVNLEAQGLDLNTYGVSVTRDAGGLITAVTSGSTNVPGFRTSGYDAEAIFSFDLGAGGRIKSRAVLTWIKEFIRAPAPGAPQRDAVGYVGQPERLLNWTTHWALKRWSADVRLNYISGYDARTPEQALALNVADQGRIGAYTTWDVFVGYELPWNAKLSAGFRNAGDRKPDLNRFAYGDNGFNRALYDVEGRVLVVSYTQRFK